MAKASGKRIATPLRLGESDYGGTLVLDARGWPFAYVYSLKDARRLVRLINTWESPPQPKRSAKR